jgi:hypothetical protein
VFRYRVVVVLLPEPLPVAPEELVPESPVALPEAAPVPEPLPVALLVDLRCCSSVAVPPLAVPEPLALPEPAAVPEPVAVPEPEVVPPLEVPPLPAHADNASANTAAMIPMSVLIIE